MQEISLEKIVQLVVQEVIQQLKNHDIKVVSVGTGNVGVSKDIKLSNDLRTKKETIDMSKYKTPLLTENHLNRLHELTGEIIIPPGTIFTPKAKQKLRETNIKITVCSKP